METAVFALVALNHVMLLLRLWLRSRTIVRRERVRGQCLVDLVRLLEDGQVCERRADGSSLRLVTPARRDDLGGSPHG